MPDYEVCDVGGCNSEALFVIQETLGNVVVVKKVCAVHYRPAA